MEIFVLHILKLNIIAAVIILLVKLLAILFKGCLLYTSGEHLGEKTKVIRTMPNTPAMVCLLYTSRPAPKRSCYRSYCTCSEI